MARRDETPPYQSDYPNKYTDNELLSAVERHGPATPTAEIADDVGCSQWTATRRLNELLDAGLVERREVGTAYVWSLK